MSWVLLAVSPDGTDERFAGSMDTEGLVYFAGSRSGATVFEAPEESAHYHRCLASMTGFTDYIFYLVDIDSDTRIQLEPPPRRNRPKKYNRFFPDREL